MKAFRAAVEAKDFDAAIELFADDATLDSPVAHTPFEGREAVAFVLRAVAATFEDFRYTDELEEDGTSVLVFRARVGDRELQGIDLIRLNAEGKIENLTVMVRPASGLMALGEAMSAKVGHLKG